MSGLRITVDERNLVSRQLTELERSQVPFALMTAINDTAFQTRQRWKEVMPRLFDRPTPLTMNAILYTKATKANPEATVFVRDEAFKGTPPARYLLAQVMGGQRRQKGFERQLTQAGLLQAGMFAVPGRGALLDRYGNLPLSLLNRVKAQLGVMSDPLTNETAASRQRRQGRAAKKGARGGNFFALRARRGRLAAGIYERVATGFGSAVKSILIFVRRATYRRRYPIFEMAQTIFSRRLPANFNASLARAVASAWNRTMKR